MDGGRGEREPFSFGAENGKMEKGHKEDSTVGIGQYDIREKDHNIIQHPTTLINPEGSLKFA